MAIALQNSSASRADPGLASLLVRALARGLRVAIARRRALDDRTLRDMAVARQELPHRAHAVAQLGGSD